MADKKTLNLIGAVTDALDLALEKDQNVLLYGEDCGYEGGVFRATATLQSKYGETRVLDAPIAEAAIVGMAGGLALAGKKPVVEIQFDGFSYPAFQQLFCQVARYRNRSRGRWAMPIVVRVPMGGGIRALEHHSEALEAIYAAHPGIKVVYPSSPYDAKGLLLAAIESKDPILFLEPKKLYRAFKQEVPAGYYTVEIGKANVIKEGSDITLVSYGSTLHEGIAAVKELGDNIDVEIIDLRTISPLDWDTVLASVRKTGKLLVAIEAVKSFSAAAEIVTRATEECFYDLKAAPVRLTGYDIIVPYARGEKYHTVTKDDISKALKKLAEL
ncbi:pyruvate dehydrogenase E1 component beta subunit [Mycoplasmoides fastidiosum]|uniref:Pyruvate dehydrogenase E1 component beta subunit n=1 Tax=Mycoplasmoides fastidiosum TaxID=92758 RepID=A0ABU0LYV6_9BACT|nr:alpha-ketoacid dehydrogenase subunit beta [Mycoplasmoides fastidiosum]MDQ0513892.1 pyruvate dehydrogenase E1 component beta subunit [Mycoplasmoides fastidiosum]UUD37694.1 alpha-ketoacid dehydrogenase subunit beta [Mycoplasmoides fastidiosum]